MASVFKRKDKNGRKSPCWTIQYMDAHGKSRQKKGFTDKQESQRLANKLEHEAKLRRDGLIDSAAEDLAIQMSRCIRQHLSEFLDTVRSRNRTQQYLNHISTRIGAILDEAGIETLAEITLDRVESAIVAIQKRNKMGPRTVNHYMQAMKAFVHWLVPRRLATNPLLELEFHNVAIDVRKERRALTSDEMSLLVDASRTSDQKVQGYSGEQRARIYLISYLTGLRKSEVASLTPESFEITGKTPILTLEARNSKHRKRDVLPLHPQLVALLRLWLPEYPPGEPLFPKLGKRKAHTMIRKDLEAAGSKLTEEEWAMVSGYAVSNRFDDGEPDVDGGLERLTQAWDAKQKAYETSKKAPRKPGSGMPAHKDNDTSTREGRIAIGEQIARAMEQDN